MGFYNIEDVALLLGLPENTVIRMAEQGRFKGSIKIEGSWKIPQENFVVGKEHIQKEKRLFEKLDDKNSKFPDVDEFNL